MQWLVNVQRDLASNLTFEAGYGPAGFSLDSTSTTRGLPKIKRYATPSAFGFLDPHGIA